MSLLLRLISLLALLTLAGCGGAGGPALTYGQVRQTAAAGGCWPDPWPTPRALTVTPAGDPTPTPIGATPAPGRPTLTALPTTTPYPRCPAAPGQTARPWPTEAPPLPSWPTMRPRLAQYGGGLQQVLELPDSILATDLAVHPTEGWPVVGAIQWTGNAEPERAFVRVLNPTSGQWDVAQNVDVGPASLGRQQRTIAVGILPDRTVLAAWASPNWPHLAVWGSHSADFGRTWSAPIPIAPDCLRVLDLATGLDGRAALLAICRADARSVEAGLVLRDARGQWGAVQRRPLPVWYASDGALEILGEGADATLVGLITSNADRPGALYLFRQRLDAGDWTVQRRQVRGPDGAALGRMAWHARGAQVVRPDGAGGVLPGVIFAVAMRDHAGVFSVVSLDGGAHWDDVQPIVSDGPETPSRFLAAVVPAYDPAADRVVALWSCCTDAMWATSPATIYGSWARLGAPWQTLGGGRRIPLALGMDQAVNGLVGAQPHNGRLVWLAWVEGSSRLVVRALDLNQIIPVGEYPTPTFAPGGP